MLVSSRGIFSSSYSFGSVIYFPGLSCSSASALSDCTFRIIVHREHCYYLKTSRPAKEAFPWHDAATNRLHDAFMSCRMDAEMKQIQHLHVSLTGQLQMFVLLDLKIPCIDTKALHLLNMITCS